MAHYFLGRKQIVESSWAEINEKWKVQYKVFERWQLKNSQTCYCGAAGTIKISKTRGLSETAVSTLKSAIEGSIGAAGLATIKGSIASSLGQEVQWTTTDSEEASFTCVSPKCGRTEITIYELVREYELAAYRCGFPFRSDHWDRKWGTTLHEAVGSYTGIPDAVAWDEKCKCEPRPQPVFEGRLSMDMARLCLLAAYRMDKQNNQLSVRIDQATITFAVQDCKEATNALHDQGLTFSFAQACIPAIFRYLGGLQSETIAAHVRIYQDPAARQAELFRSVPFPESNPPINLPLDL